MSAARHKLDEGGWFEVGHIISGNRLRTNRVIKFECGAVESPRPPASGLRIAGVLEAVRNALKF